MKFKIFITFIFFILSTYKVNANTKFFNEGVTLFNIKKFNKAKFKFEQDIVFNPKSEMSYLYLSKIFNRQNKKILEEQNLNTVILLNPKNEEAIFNLALLKIRKSNYEETKKLIKNFKDVCKLLCQQTSDLQNKLDSILKK